MNWTEWKGGKRPVEIKDVVHLRFRDGSSTQKLGFAAMGGWYAWSVESNERPNGIVAYARLD